MHVKVCWIEGTKSFILFASFILNIQYERNVCVLSVQTLSLFNSFSCWLLIAFFFSTLFKYYIMYSIQYNSIAMRFIFAFTLLLLFFWRGVTVNFLLYTLLNGCWCLCWLFCIEFILEANQVEDDDDDGCQFCFIFGSHINKLFYC